MSELVPAYLPKHVRAALPTSGFEEISNDRDGVCCDISFLVSLIKNSEPLFLG